MAGVEDPPVDSETGRGARPRNLPSSTSLWLAIAAIFLALFFLHFRGAMLLFAVPVTGFLATASGVVVRVRARRTGIGHVEALVGLSLGICTLAMTGIVGLFAWEISRLPSNGF